MAKTKHDGNNSLGLTATPENEDFRKKYKTGGLGNKLLDGYFKAVRELVDISLDSGGKAKVIEIGCGEGYSTQRINSFIPKSTSLEASEYVDHQIPFAKKNNPGMKIIQESVYELKHEDDSFDLVFLLEVMEHLDYPEKGLAEISRILKDDGYLILGVPSEPIWRALNMARGKYWSDLGNTPGHINHWSPRGLVKYIEANFGPVMAVRQPLPWTIVLAKKHEK